MPANISSGALVLTTKTFDAEVLYSSGVTMIDFYTENCAPCRRVAPIVDELAMDEDIGAKICKLDISQAPDIAQRYDIRTVPTFLFFKDGELALRFIGPPSTKAYFPETIAELNADSKDTVNAKKISGEFHKNLISSEPNMGKLRQILSDQPEFAKRALPGSRTVFPINFAANRQKTEIVKLLMEFGAELHPTDMVSLGWIDEFKAQVEADSSVLNMPSKYGLTPLDHAIMYRRNNVIDYLLDNGVDLNPKKTKTYSYPISALQIGRVDLAKKLIEMGANPEPEGSELSLLHAVMLLLPVALSKKSDQEIKNLIEFAVAQNKNPALWFSWKKQPSQIAKESGRVEIAEYVAKLESQIEIDNLHA